MRIRAVVTRDFQEERISSRAEVVKHLFAIEEEEYERCTRGKRFEKSRRESRRRDVTVTGKKQRCLLAAAAAGFGLAKMNKNKIKSKKRVRVPTQKMKDLQSSPPLNEQSDPGQVREFHTLCDLIGDRHRNSPSSPSGQQELFPGVFISSFRLAAMKHASKPHFMRQFHALFDNFFIVEECQNAVPFGRPGNNP
ncbi:hypothetical protein ILYODFUR_029636 [Ilyodon furcidens]|uniref:Uncharacterized protein n=1 Tax=Ilyodon furcidens TaxID=33524 RepID=A0ABV0UXC1_9TELE